MNLQNIEIRNFRNFENINIELNKQMNVIVGNNGSGKTAILDAIAIGLGSFFLGIDSIPSIGVKNTDVRNVCQLTGNMHTVLPQFPTEIVCTGSLKENVGTSKWSREINSKKGRTTIVNAASIKETANIFQQQIISQNNNVMLPLISYYGTGRLWVQKRNKSYKRINSRFQGYTDCLSSDSNEKLMLKWFEQETYIQLQKQKVLPELEVVKDAIKQFFESGCEGCSNVDVYFNVQTHQLEISYYDKRQQYQIHPFHELSDGYRNTLGMISDIAYRMAVLNPQCLENVITETDGVVLIDEVDLHLHPKWQKQILGTLKKVFPKIQFIVTTHSPSVISTARTDELLILENNMCSRFDYNVYGKDANSVLTEIMGTYERPNEIAEMFNSFNASLDNDDYTRASKILDDLKSRLGENDSGVIEADIKLSFAKEWED